MGRSSWGLPRYIITRVWHGLLLLLGIMAVMFALVHLAPGDPVKAIMGDFPAPDAFEEEIREQYGLNEPLWKQFLLYLGSLVRGDFGYSFAKNTDVADLIWSLAPNTILLMGTSVVLAAVIGIPLGVVAAYRRGSRFDNVVSFVSLAGFAMPVFWLGQLLIIALALKIAVFPVGGLESVRAPSEGLGRVGDMAWHLVLPAVALSFRYLALFLRVTRASMADTYRADFVLTARSKGLKRSEVTIRHVFRNALLPVVTVIGYELGFILSGSVLVETVFSWPGLGRLLYTSITQRDTPTVLGVFFVFAVGVLVVNLLTDVLYARLDPRVRLGGGTRATR